MTVLRVVLVLVGVLALGFFTLLPGVVDRRMNRILPAGDATVTAEARRLHATLDLADLHADALLWPRDLNRRHDHGHVDVPRLLDGRVALQVFSAVTKTPRGLNYERNAATSDNITLLAIAQRYPLGAWTSLRARALHQARRLYRMAAASSGTLSVVTSRDSLTALQARRERGEQVVGGILALEGLQVVEGDVANIDVLFKAGYRIFGLTHFFDNEVGGSAHGETRGGLTPLGRDVLARIERLGGIVDLAHASPQLVHEVLTTTSVPIIVSHAGVQATCPGPRNLSDDQLRAIAARGGIIGIGYWDGAICQPSAAAHARAVRHAIAVAGEDHVALGSDFDGATTVPFHTGELVRVTQALLSAGLSEAQIRKVTGANAFRFLRAHLD